MRPVFNRLSNCVRKHQRDTSPALFESRVSTKPMLLVEWTVAYPKPFNKERSGSDDIGRHRDQTIIVSGFTCLSLASRRPSCVVLPLPSTPETAIRNPRPIRYGLPREDIAPRILPDMPSSQSGGEFHRNSSPRGDYGLPSSSQIVFRLV